MYWTLALPVLALAHVAAVLGQTPTSNVLIMLQDQTQRDPVVRSGDQAVVQAHLTALGASGVVRYSAINALGATLPLSPPIDWQSIRKSLTFWPMTTLLPARLRLCSGK